MPKSPDAVSLLMSGRVAVRSVGFVLSVNATLAFSWVGLVLGTSAISLLGIANTAPLLDQLVNAIASNSFTVKALANSESVRLAAALIVGGSIVKYVRAACEMRLGMQTSDALNNAVCQQAALSSLERCEQADFHDQFSRARGETNARPLAIVESFGHVVQGAIVLTGLTVILAEVSPVLIAAIALAVFPPVLASVRAGKRQHGLWIRDTPARRRFQQLGDLLVSCDAAAEIRTRGLGQTLATEVAGIRATISSNRLSQFNSSQFEMGTAELLSAAIVVATAVFVLGSGALASVSVGGAALVFQAFNRASGTLSGILLSLSSVQVNALYLSELFGFLDREGQSSRTGTSTTRKDEDVALAVSLSAVAFRHPGADKDTIHDVSFSCETGSFVAVVGRNGAGKSTLLRVVAGVYRATSGEVLAFSQEVLGWSDKSRIAMIGFQHQEPVHYPGTVRENITIAPTGVAASEEQVGTALCFSGSDSVVSALPSGTLALIGKDFANATELSSGQWQRLALARAACFEPRILVSDEPTAALDGEAERRLIERLLARPSRQTLIVASHSRAIVEAADKVVVLEQGRVVAVGSPAVLAESCEVYRSLFGRSPTTAG